MDDQVIKPLDISSHQDGNVLIVSPVGEVDLWSADLLRQALRNLGTDHAPRVVVDMSEVPFIDSTGLGVLVGALKGTRDVGGSLHLVVSADRVRKVLAVTRLDEVFPVHSSLVEAVAAAGHDELGEPSG